MTTTLEQGSPFEGVSMNESHMSSRRTLELQSHLKDVEPQPATASNNPIQNTPPDVFGISPIVRAANAASEAANKAADEVAGAIAELQPSNSFLIKLFGSNESIVDKKEENLIVDKFFLNKYVIHPETPLRQGWDSIAIILTIYTVFLLPARTAFLWEVFERQGEDREGPNWDGWMVMDLCIDLFFMCDIVLNFFTGYYKSSDEDYVVMHMPSIARHYMGGWMVLDCIASVPLDLLVLGGGSSFIWRLPRVLKILRLSRLLRLLRLSRMVRYMERFKIQELLNISDFQIRLMKLICTVITFIHWNACIQWLVVVALDYPEDSWAARAGLQHKSISVKYSWSIFRALSHMLSIGYGQEPPYTLVEAWVVSTSMVLGASLFAVFVGIITTLLIQLDSGSAMYAMKMSTVNRYMKHQALPLDLRERVRDAYDYRWQTNSTFDAEAMLCELPVSLRTDIAMFNCRELLRSVPFFTDSEPGFVSTIVTILRSVVFMEGDVIMRLGEVPEVMYFILHGAVKVTLEEEMVTYLGEGSYFGEVSMVFNKHRTADITTVQDTELYSLSKDDFERIFPAFPEVMTALTRIAQHRFQALQAIKAKAGLRPSMDIENANARLHTRINYGINQQPPNLVHRRSSVARIDNWRKVRRTSAFGVISEGISDAFMGSRRGSTASIVSGNVDVTPATGGFASPPTGVLKSPASVSATPATGFTSPATGFTSPPTGLMSSTEKHPAAVHRTVSG